MKPKILNLSLKKAPFEVMETGEKPIEYRIPSAWIKSRFVDKKGNPKSYDLVKFTNGYGNHRPNFTAVFKGLAFASSSYTMEYSNGLSVDVEPGMFCIALGEIVERNNIEPKEVVEYLKEII